MDLEIIKTQHGLKLLDNYLSNRSYISGCQPSQNDLLVIQKILEDYTSIRQTPLPHVNRWVSHIQSFSTSDTNSFPKSNEAIMILPQANSTHLPQSQDLDTPKNTIEKTKLLYFQPSPQLKCAAIVQSVRLEENSKEPNTYSIVVNQTVCHPQGGGQPFDTGFIYGKDSQVFQIVDARMDRETECIRHIGRFTNGILREGDVVNIEIDKDKRLLYCRLHTAGHLIDAALHLIGYNWEPTKGYHFPNGPYVEYKGSLVQSEIESIKSRLQEKATDLISQNVPIKIQLDVSQDNAMKICGELDPIYQSSPFLRLVSIGDYFTCPCGGTHVESLEQLKSITIPKIKLQKSKGVIQVRYDVVS